MLVCPWKSDSVGANERARDRQTDREGGREGKWEGEKEGRGKGEADRETETAREACECCLPWTDFYGRIKYERETQSAGGSQHTAMAKSAQVSWPSGLTETRERWNTNDVRNSFFLLLFVLLHFFLFLSFFFFLFCLFLFLIFETKLYCSHLRIHQPSSRRTLTQLQTLPPQQCRQMKTAERGYVLARWIGLILLVAAVGSVWYY